MKKSLLSITVALIFVIIAALPQNVLAQSDIPGSYTRIANEVERIQKLNPQIADRNKINVGDTIVVDQDLTGSPIVYIATYWLNDDGSLSPAGTLWKISEAYLNRTLATVPPTAMATTVYLPESRNDSFRWFLIITALLIAGFFVILSYLKAKKELQRTRDQVANSQSTLSQLSSQVASLQNKLSNQEEAAKENSLDMNTGTPMIAGGISDSPNVALRQIESASQSLFHDPNRVVRKVERGYLDGDAPFVEAPVWYREGARTVLLLNQTDCYRVTVGRRDNAEYSHIEYWLQHCGNLVGEIGNGRFELPDGWQFIINTDNEGRPVSAVAEEPLEVNLSGGELNSADPKPMPGTKTTIIITRQGGMEERRIQTDRYVTSVESGEKLNIGFSN